MTEEEEIVEPLLPEPEPQEPPPSPVLVPLEESAPLEEAETADTPLEESSEEEPPPPKRVRSSAAAARSAKAREPKAKAEPKAEPKRRGRPPGSRNKPGAATPLLVHAPVEPAQSPMEQIMASMRERRQAHQERQHLFFQSFLP